MTVSTTTSKIIQLGNAATTVWPFPFPGVAASDLLIYFTDATGVITLLASNLYTVSLNAPVSPNPTGIGGTVTYPLTGSPIALGTSLTILRSLPEQQNTSFTNQGTLYQQAVEQSADYLVMLVQQLQELLNRQIAVNVSDPVPGLIPPVAARAGLVFAWDSSGNPSAVSTAPAGTISSAWSPVVGSATLAAGLALLGLTGVAPEPPGVVKAFAGSVIPTGYLGCFGQAVSRTGATAALFAAIGTTYGVGDGATTFNLPDLRGRQIANLDNQGGVAANRLTATSITGGGGPTALGGFGGAETHTLIAGELPVITPTFTGANISAITVASTHVQIAAGGGTFGALDNATVNASIPITGTISSFGSGNPMVDLDPTMIMNFIIKT